MRFLFLPVPRPLRLHPVGMMASRAKIIRKAGGGGKSDPDSGSTGQEKKGGAVAAGLKSGGAGLKAEVDAVATMTRRVYGDLKSARPMASG